MNYFLHNKLVHGNFEVAVVILQGSWFEEMDFSMIYFIYDSRHKGPSWSGSYDSWIYNYLDAISAYHN